MLGASWVLFSPDTIGRCCILLPLIWRTKNVFSDFSLLSYGVYNTWSPQAAFVLCEATPLLVKITVLYVCWCGIDSCRAKQIDLGAKRTDSKTELCLHSPRWRHIAQLVELEVSFSDCLARQMLGKQCLLSQPIRFCSFYTIVQMIW